MDFIVFLVYVLMQQYLNQKVLVIGILLLIPPKVMNLLFFREPIPITDTVWILLVSITTSFSIINHILKGSSIDDRCSFQEPLLKLVVIETRELGLS